MTPNNDLYQQKVTKLVQELLSEEKKNLITPSLINEKMDLILKMEPKWAVNLDRQAVVYELIRRFSVWTGRETTLKSEAGHVHWLTSSRKSERRYWQRFREWQERELPPSIIESLDESTDSVLGLLEDPLREGPWDRRGLVVGHVQSGKTGHYTGLISKAADAGYKIIIILAGTHNNLRSQTQVRLDEGFLGFNTKPGLEGYPIIGVGEIDSDPAISPNFATNRSETGDFGLAAARNLGVTPEQRPWLFVVKKNKSILERLLSWVTNHVANTETEEGRRVVTNLPLLVIDDEADHASVDTGENVVDELGNPDEEHQPTTINRLIRRLLISFTRSAYVGYTATPFANIFIHERGETKLEGPDLFPAAFIINLSAPSDYFGPARFFRFDALTDNAGSELDLIRIIEDHCTDDGRAGWMPPRHRNGHVPLLEAFPGSLTEAINAFLVACCVRNLRGQGTKHSSMLIHVTRFNSVQEVVTEQVNRYIGHIRQRLTRNIGCEDIVSAMKGLYERDFAAKCNKAYAGEYPDWSSVAQVLPNIIADIQVKAINGSAKDTLDYIEHEATGLKVIAIGGDKLSRGLTLEGLCVSYFLRASKMYDTLMQMGRWFGYRPGYVDLCRLYITQELSDWFGHIADASEELREEFDLMASIGATPREYGLKVQSHPILLVTSRLKMRTAKTLSLSFSGNLLETISFFRNTIDLSRNFNALKGLIASLGRADEINPFRNWNGTRNQWEGYIWKGVPADSVVNFLQGYKTHPEVYKVNSALLVEFIRKMNERGELTEWQVALLGGEGDECHLPGEVKIASLKRSLKGIIQADRYSIGRLMSPRDEGLDLDTDSWSEALRMTKEAWARDAGRGRVEDSPDLPSGPAIRCIRGFGASGVVPHPERGVLFLYVIDPFKASKEALFGQDTPFIAAFGISFPGSNSGEKVMYSVNNILWEQEYGTGQ